MISIIVKSTNHTYLGVDGIASDKGRSHSCMMTHHTNAHNPHRITSYMLFHGKNKILLEIL